jgi:hypothetical protein
MSAGLGATDNGRLLKVALALTELQSGHFFDSIRTGKSCWYEATGGVTRDARAYLITLSTCDPPHAHAELRQ